MCICQAKLLPFGDIWQGEGVDTYRHPVLGFLMGFSGGGLAARDSVGSQS